MTDTKHTIEITTDNIASVMSQNDTVIVEFWASWCAPCRSFAPVFEQAAADHPDIVFATIDAQEQNALAVDANVFSIPTIIAFKNGRAVFRHKDIPPAGMLEQLIEELRAQNPASIGEA